MAGCRKSIVTDLSLFWRAGKYRFTSRDHFRRIYIEWRNKVNVHWDTPIIVSQDVEPRVSVDGHAGETFEKERFALTLHGQDKSPSLPLAPWQDPHPGLRQHPTHRRQTRKYHPRQNYRRLERMMDQFQHLY